MKENIQQSRLFSEQELDNIDGNLFAEREQSGPMTCLGMEFENDEARREYFRTELRKKLPELRHIEGFPIGEDDDIIALSDPPYYTACPNPWLNDFIAQWEAEKANLEARGLRTSDFEVKEPYAADVSEGKYDPLYMYHPYLTKVPPQAISHYLKHYTQRGDIIFDGFAGTGMTGVSSSLLDRKAICSDLSPLAGFISYNYLSGLCIEDFISDATRLLSATEKKLGWLYETKHTNGDLGTINYILWSDVFVCPNCGAEIVFWHDGVSQQEGKVKSQVSCRHCGSSNSKTALTNATETIFDTILGESITINKIIPVKINYTYKGKKYEKVPDSFDLETIKRAETTLETYRGLRSFRMPDGDESRRNDKRGITHTHQFYTKRIFLLLSELKKNISSPILNILLTKVAFQSTLLYRYTYMNGVWGAGGGPLSGTLYIPSLIKELNVFKQLKEAIQKRSVLTPLESIRNCAISVNSASNAFSIKDESIDYIFTDPPFGANLMYSELNVISESWLNVLTNNEPEAIVNKTQQKDVIDYQSLMTSCFREYCRILKPGRWMTVEFSNTSASVWNSIQRALQAGGFVIANVSALDKKKGSFKAVTTTTAVKQDLIITCYKPTDELTQKFQNSSDTAANVWDFVSELLEHLPVHIIKEQKTTTIVERSPKILFDRLIAYYVQHGYPVPMNAQEFQKGLRDRFIELDGMFFTAPQAAEYKEKKREAPEMLPMGLIVSDEANGIEWLKLELKTSQTYQEIQPKWLQAVGAVRKNDIIPELRQLLEENFIEEPDGKWRLPNIQDDKDVAALRTKALMREFKLYVEQASKPKGKIKEARVEALRAGFKQCYIDKDFKTIVMVGDRIPANLRDEDEVLLQFYDIALNKI